MAVEGTIRLDFDVAAMEDACRRYRVRELALFGSVLRDDFTPESDVDVLVEFDPELRYGLFYLMDVQNALSAVFGRPVDLVENGCIHPFIADDVMRRRRVIYVAP